MGSTRPSAPISTPRPILSPSNLPKINSETNLAVQLLLAVSDASAGRQPISPPSSPPPRVSDSSDDSDATDGAAPDTDADLSSPSIDPSLSIATTPISSSVVPSMIPTIPSSTSTTVTTTNTTNTCNAPIITNSSTCTAKTITITNNHNDTNVNTCNGTGSTAPLFKYSREERAEALQRFREKKRRRQFRKRVRYHVRKRLAEARPRYKGRFSKPPPGENYDDGTPGPPAKVVRVSD